MTMNPNGTPSIDDVCAMMEQLMSWERVEVVKRFISLREFLADSDAVEIENATGYYVYEDEPESECDLEDESAQDLIDELLDRGDNELMLDSMDINIDIIPYLESKGYTVMED